MLVRAALAVFVSVAIAGCGGGSGNSSPSPAPTPGPLVANPASVTLSLSASGGDVASLNGIAVSQAFVKTGDTFSYSSTNCWSNPTAASTVIAEPSALTSGVLAGGTLSGSFGPIVAQNAGSCSITLTPTAGTGTVVQVTVIP